MADDKSRSFETSLARLDQIVKALENEDQELERAVELYKEGRELIARCEAQLKTAQQAIDAANAPANASAPTRPAEEPMEDEAPF